VQQVWGADIFSGLFNFNKPIFLSGITVIKRQAAESGKAVINEFGRKYLRNIIQEQSKIALQYLSNDFITDLNDTLNLFAWQMVKRIEIYQVFIYDL